MIICIFNHRIVGTFFQRTAENGLWKIQVFSQVHACMFFRIRIILILKTTFSRIIHNTLYAQFVLIIHIIHILHTIYTLCTICTIITYNTISCFSLSFHRFFNNRLYNNQYQIFVKYFTNHLLWFLLPLNDSWLE